MVAHNSPRSDIFSDTFIISAYVSMGGIYLKFFESTVIIINDRKSI